MGLSRIFSILMVAQLWLPLVVLGQVRGKVTDAANNGPLQGAVVSGDGPESSPTVSGPDGSFVLQGDHTLLNVRMLGYSTQSLKVSGTDTRLTIALEANSTELNEIVVEAMQTRRKLLTVPGAVALATQKELQRDNDISVVPVFNRMPGVVMQTGALNTNRLTIRGIGARSLYGTNKIRAYLDGIPLTSGDGETTLQDIDMALLDRVEVVKGPSSSIYGAGLGGTVLMGARKPAFREAGFSTTMSGGDFGLFRTVNLLEAGGENAAVQILHSHTESAGYRENSQYRRGGFSVLGQFGAGNTSVSVLANLVSLKAFIPSSIDSVLFRDRPSAAAANWKAAEGYEAYNKGMMGVSVQQQLGPSLRHVSSLFVSFRDADEPRPFNILREGTHAYGLRSAWDWQPGGSANTRLSVGTEYFKDWFIWRTYRIQNRESGEILSDNEENRTYLNLFAQAEHLLTEKLRVTAGLNFNTTRYTLTDLFKPGGTDLSGDYTFDPAFSPRLALGYLANAHTHIYVSASHGFSPPTLEETLTPSGQINPGIRPEQGWNFEVGARGQWQAMRLSYDVSVFSMHIRDLLVARRTAEDAFIGVNAGKSVHSGLEAAAFWQMTREGHPVFAQAQWFGNLTLASYRFAAFVDGDLDFSGNRITGTPQAVANTGFDLVLKNGLYVHLNYLYTGDMPMNDANTRFSESFGVANLKTGFRKLLGSHLGTDLFFGLNNLFDARYASMILPNALPVGPNLPRYYYPGLPRNWFGGIRLQVFFGTGK